MSDEKVLCYTGGMDSYCLRLLNEYDRFVFFNLGTEEAEYESLLVQEHVPDEKLEVAALTDLAGFEMSNKTIPLRNVIMAFLASNYGNVIHMGGTFGDRFNVRDGDEIAADMASALLNHFNGHGYDVDTMPQDHSRYRVEFPVCHLTKGEILERAVRKSVLGVGDIIRDSKSCHYGDEEMGCGECEDCIRTATAAGYVLQEPERLHSLLKTNFRVNPFTDATVEAENRMERRKGEVEQYRKVKDSYLDWVFMNA